MRSSIKVKKLIELILITVLLLLTSNVYAATNSFKATLNVNNSSVKIGDTVTITIQLSDIAIESGEQGIGAYTAKLDFDSSILEYVSTSGTSKWEAPLYQDKLIAGNTNDGEVVKEAQNIGTITFKVKENATLGETTITLTNFSGSNAESDISADDSSIKLTVLSKDSTGSGSTGGGEGGSGSGSIVPGGSGSGSSGTLNGSGSSGGSNQTGSGGTNGNTSSGSTSKDDIKEGTLPKTGHSNIVIYMLIGVFTLIAISYLVRIKLINKKLS